MRGVRRRSVLVAALCLLAFGSAAASASAAKPPADLVALEQKMQALHVGSERGTLVEVISGESLGGESLLGLSSSGRSRPVRRRKEPVVRLTTHPRQSLPFFTADFEASESPKLEVIRGDLLGALSFQERVIGEDDYMRFGLLTLIDGGKPWVSTDPSERAQEHEQGGAEGISSPTSTLVGPTSKLVEMLAHAGSVVEVGPREVDGQQTIEFQAKLDGAQLLSLSSSKPSRAARKKLRRSQLTLELFLADDGLPVRTRMQTQVGTSEITVVEDILATEVPVVVQAPPASETITKAQLKKREETSTAVHLTKRERKEIRRFASCLKRHRPKGRQPPTKRELKKLLRECPEPKEPK